MDETRGETTVALERVRASFEKQGLMRLLKAEVVEAGEGRCVIEVPFRDELTQQERYFHGAVTGAIADNAGGYAALTLAPPRSPSSGGRGLPSARIRGTEE